MHEQSIFQLTTPMMLAIFASGFALIWWHHRNMRSAMYFSLAFGIGALGLLIDFFRNSLDPAAAVFATNVPYSVSIVLLVAGVAARYEARFPLRFIGLVFAITMGTLAWFTFVRMDILIQTHAGNIGAGLMIARSLPFFLNRRRKKIDTFLLGLFGISALQFMTRTAIVDYFWHMPVTAETYSVSPLALSLHLAVAVSSMTGASALFVAMGMDIISKVEKKGEVDGLTGLLNRRAFEEKAESKIRETVESGLPLSLLVCDIDHFKRINDSWGHAIGDVVIRRFADVIGDASRKSDIAGRVGGEEFCLLLPTASTDLGLLLAQSIRTSFHAERFEGLPDEAFTASFGVAEMRRGESYDELFVRADAALYKAKKNGRDRVQVAEGRKRPRGEGPESLKAA